MWMMGLSLTVEWVWGMTDAMGWGFRGLFGETPGSELLHHWFGNEHNTQDLVDVLT
jgi:hypothetical protein